MPETSEYTRLGDGGNQSFFGRWQYLTRLEKGLIVISTIFGIVIFTLAIALAKCDAQVVPTTVAPETTTEPSSTTVLPNSTTVSPSSTTVSPNSTTVSPSSTTVSPSSTTVPPSSTTIPPSTTTVPLSSTTIPPSTVTVPLSSTTVPPSSTTVLPSSTTVPLISTTVNQTKSVLNETEITNAENLKQLATESTISSEEPISENTTNLLKNIPPIPVAGIKLISPQRDEVVKIINLAENEETVTVSEASAHKYSEVPENSNDTSGKNSVLSRKKRIDISSTADSKRDNPVYE